MDNLTIPVILPEYEYVVMFLLIILIVQLLKRRGIFNDTHQPVFDRLVIELALPAIIFASLATTHVHADWIMPVLIMIAAIIVCLVIAWGTCRMFRLTPAVTGTVVILSGFGSTYTFAAPLVGSIFGKASEQMSFALFLDTLGVAIPFFTIGVLIAGYYGQKERGENPSASSTLRQFLATPIFLAFILGLLSSLLFANLLVPGAGVFADVFSGFFTVIQDSLSLLVWIAIGLLLRPIRLRTLLPLLALVVAVQMIIMPALVFCGANAAGLSTMSRQVLVIMASMPSGAVAAVMASRYGCDGKLAAAILICTYVVSFITVPLVLFLMGRF